MNDLNTSLTHIVKHHPILIFKPVKRVKLRSSSGPLGQQTLFSVSRAQIALDINLRKLTSKVISAT